MLNNPFHSRRPTTKYDLHKAQGGRQEVLWKAFKICLSSNMFPSTSPLMLNHHSYFYKHYQDGEQVLNIEHEAMKIPTTKIISSAAL